MKTTEIFVEQVLIGFLVLVILALPFLPEVLGEFKALDETTHRLVTGVILTFVAYLLGMVFDRTADTFIEDLDRHNRAREALKALIKHRKKQGKIGFPSDPVWKDPFPEDRLRMLALDKGGAIAEQMQYLRTRMRLSRALAVFLPTLTFTLALGIGRLPADNGAIGGIERWSSDFEGQLSIWWIIMIPAGYLMAIAGDSIMRAIDQPKRVAKAPRTDKDDMKGYAIQRGFVPGAEDKRLKDKSLYEDVFGARLFWLNAILAIATGLLAIVHHDPIIPAILIIGFAVAIASAWSWWRISRTFMLFLQSFHENLVCRQGQGQDV